MNTFVRFFRASTRPKSRRSHSAARRHCLDLEPLEGRSLMAVLGSVAFDLKGQEIYDFASTFPGAGTGYFNAYYTPGYVSNGPTATYHVSSSLTNVRSVSIAFDKAGDILQDFVSDTGKAYQFTSDVNGLSSTTALGSGVESMSVAFEPDGTGVSDVVYEDGTYDEFTSAGGPTIVASNVVSASVAIDTSGNKLQDYVTADGVLHEIKGATTTTLGDQVVSASVAFDGAGGVVRLVVFTDGQAYQYDYAGQHRAGSPFTPVLQPYQASTSIAFNPTSGEEYATVSFPNGPDYQYNASGATVLKSNGFDTQSASTAFSKDGKIIQDVVSTRGDGYEFINGVYSGVVGSGGIQSISIVFDPQGNEVADVVYQNGEYDEFTADGKSQLIASNVVSASVAIDTSGNKLQDYVTADGVLHEIKGTTTTTLGDQVVSASIAFDGNGGIARSILFTNGLAYQYDYAGEHLQGQVFDPYRFNPNRLAFKAKLPGVALALNFSQSNFPSL